MLDALITFCTREQITLIGPLGNGREGAVYETTRPSAIKIHHERTTYATERDAYLRLRDHGITTLGGLRIPTLIQHNDELRIIEMSIVRPPYLLDFGSVWFDEPPDFSEEVIAQWHDDIRDRFEDRFQEVLSVVDALARHAGIILLDVSPTNIKFDGPEGSSHCAK